MRSPTAKLRMSLSSREPAWIKTYTGDGSSAVGHGMEHPFTLSYDAA